MGFSTILKLDITFKNEGSMLASGCARVRAMGKSADVVAEKMVCSKLLFPEETQVVRAEVVAPLGSSPEGYACAG